MSTPPADRLGGYRAKRDAAGTPEPGLGEEEGRPDGEEGRRFVLQEHHATRLHWDLRLERDGVLVSFAVPNGLPPDLGTNHLAIRTEDHPLAYLDFQGEIPRGSYGAGTMTISDRGTYEVLKWDPGKIEIHLHGERHDAQFALFVIDRDRTLDPERDGAQWMVHRMGTPQDPDAQPLPDRVAPMLARPGTLPRGDDWRFEIKWDGARVLAHSRPGQLRLRSRNGNDVTGRFPELGALQRALGEHRAVLDGEVVAFDEEGRPSFAALQRRLNVTDEGRVRRLVREQPVRYVVFDLLWLDGHDRCALPYAERRARLAALELERRSGGVVTVPEAEADGEALLEAVRALGLEGVMAKRRRAPYLPGVRSDAFTKVKLTGEMTFEIAGWTAGEGGRRGHPGALLLGLPDPDGGPLRYVGRVGSGLDERTLDELTGALAQREVDADPLAPSSGGTVAPRGARFTGPGLRCEVRFTGWTPDGVLRHPVFVRLVAPEGDGAGPAAPGAGKGTRVTAAGRELRVTNLDKPLWPDGTTKGELIGYYAQIAPVLVPHLADRPLTMRRWPDGVTGPTFFEKRAPGHRPDWVAVADVTLDGVAATQLLVQEPATLAWLGNLAAIELHTPLHRLSAEDGTAEILAFDLDPGAPATAVECARVAFLLRGMFAGLGLDAFVKSSGSKGLQVYVPLNAGAVPYAHTKAFARTVAELLAREEPGLVVSRQVKAERRGRVLVDWLQNEHGKTTVSVYSVRAAHDRPTISAPLTWDELQDLLDAGDPDAFLLGPDEVLARVAELGDVWADVLTLDQELPVP